MANVVTTDRPYKLTNEPGKNLVVISAPSVTDPRYQGIFNDIIDFDVTLVNALLKRDNVLLVADKHTLPLLEDRVPLDVLLESSIEEIRLRDFAPVMSKTSRLTKFNYAPSNLDANVSSRIDASFNQFMKEHFVSADKFSDLTLDLGNVIYDGVSKAIVTSDSFSKNLEDLQEWAIKIKMRNTFGATLILDPINSTMTGENWTMRLEQLMAFMDPHMLAMSQLPEPESSSLKKQITKAYRNQLKILELPYHYVAEHWQNYASVCGLYTAMLVTDDFVYVPVYGNDPNNWGIGHSTLMDKHVLQLIQVNTDKFVVAVPVPHSVCQMGGGLRTLTWQLSGPQADHLISMGRMRANIKRAQRRLQTRTKGRSGSVPAKPRIDFAE